LVLIISFLLTRGWKKINNNEIFWEIKNPTKVGVVRKIEDFHPLVKGY
jgi:hypothetical protein